MPADDVKGVPLRLYAPPASIETGMPTSMPSKVVTFDVASEPARTGFCVTSANTSGVDRGDGLKLVNGMEEFTRISP